MYAFNNGGPPGFLRGVAVNEDGRVLHVHTYKTEAEMKQSLTTAVYYKRRGQHITIVWARPHFRSTIGAPVYV